MVDNGVAIDRKSVYNRLTRPGFVKVIRDGSVATFYYLYNDRFGELAKAQGAMYYPKNLGPLADARIPAVEELSPSTDVDITGTIISHKDDIPLRIRAVNLEDADIVNGSLTGITEGLVSLLKNPIGKEKELDNALVILSGLRRWMERYEAYDTEKKSFIEEALKPEVTADMFGDN